MSLLVGLDVGTTAVKAAAFDTSGRELAQGRALTPWRSVPTGAELDPDDLLDAAVAAAREAVAGAGAGQVAGLGVASMAETGVLVDGDGRPVVPSIAWHDTRGDPERLARDLPSFPARTGLPASTLCTLVKYRWMRDHWPDTARGVRWLNVAEWIVRGLGGELATELSLASRTGFYDIHAKRPWDDALAWADAPAGLAPEPVPAGTPMGRTDDGAVLTVGGHDHLAAAVGAGAAGEGDVLDSCGTAEAFVRATKPLSARGRRPRRGERVHGRLARGARSPGAAGRRVVRHGTATDPGPGRRRSRRARRDRGGGARDRARGPRVASSCAASSATPVSRSRSRASAATPRQAPPTTRRSTPSARPAPTCWPAWPPSPDRRAGSW